MSIKDLLEKINPFYNLLVILILAFIFFILGRISVLEERHSPIKIEYPQAKISNSQTASAVEASINSGSVEAVTNEDGEVIGSKSGKKYYFPWCGTVKRIKPENQVRFASSAEAKKAGFTAGGNCKGLK